MKSLAPSFKLSSLLVASALGLFSSMVAAQAQPSTAPKSGIPEKAAACAACHGADGIKVIDPSYPILAGQYKDYLFRALQDYKSGARKNAIMNGQAAGLSKKEMQELAAYFASLPGPLDLRK
jgi:cytochrome c553